MPTYQEALSAEPGGFPDLARQMTEATIDLSAHQIDYGSKVDEINRHWQDTANEAFNGEVGTVNDHIAKVIADVDAAAASLLAAGTRMFIDCNMMTLIDAAAKAAGFEVQPAPLVTLGPAQRTAIAMAGPFGAFMESCLQSDAAARTLSLQGLLSLVNESDATAGTALFQGAELLRPLEDKRAGAPQAPESPAADDQAEAGGEEAAEEEQSAEPDEEATEEEPKEEEPTEPGQEQPQEPGQPGGPQPTAPQTPSGMEGMAQPDLPAFEDSWSAAEPPDPDDLTGGLASGGGLGSGGLGAGSGAGGMGGGGFGAGAGTVPASGAGGMGGAMGAPVGAAGAAGAGARPGGAGMMGAGAGGRGGGPGNEDEVGRESNLIEDPDEDVWGIAKAADDLYE